MKATDLIDELGAYCQFCGGELCDGRHEVIMIQGVTVIGCPKYDLPYELHVDFSKWKQFKVVL